MLQCIHSDEWTEVPVEMAGAGCAEATSLGGINYLTGGSLAVDDRKMEVGRFRTNTSTEELSFKRDAHYSINHLQII